MNPRFRDRHLYGAGAAACAVCCAPPVLALLGIAGAGTAATIATAAFAGIAFAVVVAGATLIGLVEHKRRSRPAPPLPSESLPVTIHRGPGGGAPTNTDPPRSGHSARLGECRHDDHPVCSPVRRRCSRGDRRTMAGVAGRRSGPRVCRRSWGLFAD